MLNGETVKFLKSITQITNSVMLRYPITVGRTESADVAYMVDLSKLDTDGFDDDLGIYNLSSFLSMFNLFSEKRDITVDNNVISIKDGTISASYLLANPAVLMAYSFKEEQFYKADEFPTVLEVDFTALDLKRLKSASDVFGELDSLIVECDESTTFKLSCDNDGFKKSSNSFKFTKPVTASKNFKISVSLETVFKVPVADYKFIVKYNKNNDGIEGKSPYRIILKGEKMSLILATKSV